MWQIINALICNLIAIIGVFIFGWFVLGEQKNISKKKLFLLLLSAIILYTTIYLYLNKTLKTLVMGVVVMFFYKYTFEINYKKSIFTTILYMFILLFVEIFQLFFITEILHKNKNFGYNIAGTITSNIVTFIIFVLIICLCRKILRKLINTKIANNIKIIILSILTFICIGMFFYTIIGEFSLTGNSFLYLTAITILLIMLSTSIKQAIENNKITQQYDKLLEFMTTYENEIEKQRILRHETKNEFLTIKARINDKQNNKEIIKYIDDLLKDKITINQEEYAKFGYLPANGIKGLCYLKTQEAEAKGLHASINISKRINKSNIYNLNIKEQKNLGKILGVFLDNAIEASLKSKNKKFGIEAYLNLKKECQIIISNSYDGILELEKLGKEKFSTKGKNRGHGLLLVKCIVNENNIFSTKTNITNDLYIQIITIKNRNEFETRKV